MDETNILSLLLKESSARRALVDSAEDFRETYSLDERLFDFVRQLDQGQLEEQAISLLKKRFGQIRHFLPSTLAAIGSQAWPIFESWGEQHWPTGHRRHLQDAVDFVNHCATVGHPYSAKEKNRIQFQWDRPRFRIHWLPADESNWFGLQFIWRCQGGYRDCWWAI